MRAARIADWDAGPIHRPHKRPAVESGIEPCISAYCASGLETLRGAI